MKTYQIETTVKGCEHPYISFARGINSHEALKNIIQDIDNNDEIVGVEIKELRPSRTDRIKECIKLLEKKSDNLSNKYDALSEDDLKEYKTYISSLIAQYKKELSKEIRERSSK